MEQQPTKTLEDLSTYKFDASKYVTLPPGPRERMQVLLYKVVEHYGLCILDFLGQEEYEEAIQLLSWGMGSEGMTNLTIETEEKNHDD